METIKVIYLDSDRDNSVGESLSKIFADSPGDSVTMKTISSANGSEPNYLELESAYKFLDPDLVLFAFGAYDSEKRLQSVRSIRAVIGRTPLLAAIGDEGVEQLPDLLSSGLTDFVTVPLRQVDILPRLRRFKIQSRHWGSASLSVKERLGMPRLIGEAPAFLDEIRKIPQIAKCAASVLIVGETGTGKEMVARAVHCLSPRADKPFVALNCGALPPDLVENELFGHNSEAFTGAQNSRKGIVQEAASGTLFLDEVDSMPLSAQVKLLRFLQEKEFRPLGSSKLQFADVRVLAATNLNPEKAMQEGKLRRDLYYRLNTLPIYLPPLRNRKEDIPLLLEHFLDKYTREYSHHNLSVGRDVVSHLMEYSWPGNIRELEQIIQRAVLLGPGPILGVDDFRLHDRVEPGRGRETFQSAKSHVIRVFERNYIESLLMQNHGNISRAAVVAGKNRRAFWQLLQKHGILADSFREPWMSPVHRISRD